MDPTTDHRLALPLRPATEALNLTRPEGTTISTSATSGAVLTPDLFSHPYTYNSRETIYPIDHRISREGLFRDPFDRTTTATAGRVVTDRRGASAPHHR